MREVRASRLASLDALRGVAAGIVLLNHCCESLPALESSRALHHLFPGSGAVLIFFVLSGLVLAMTFVHRDGDRYVPFVVKRLFRIWPAFAFAVFASAGLRLAIGHHDVLGTTATFSGNWASPLTATAVIEHLAMLGSATDLDSPMWSLIHEMRISLLFPALIALTLAEWRVALGATAAACLMVSPLHGYGQVFDSVLMTVRFAVLFVMGAVIALRMPDLRHRLDMAPRPVRLALWVVSLAGVATSADYSSTVSSLASEARLLIHGAAAAGVVLLCVTGKRAGRWLSMPLPVYLGRISYSLYLLHCVVLTAVVQGLRDVAPAPILVGAAALLSIAVADLSQRFIERPMTLLGRKLARAIASRRIAPELVER